VFDKAQKLWQLISMIGGLSSITDIATLAKVAGKVWSAVGEVKSIRNAQDAFRVAIAILEPIVQLTTNEWDDGVLIGTRALANSPEFVDWCNDRMAAQSFVDAVMPETGMPDGALAIREPLLLTLPPTSQTDAIAMPIIGGVGLAAKLAKFLPMVLALVEMLMSLANTNESDNE
jgi:hypothetical protein